MYVLKKNTFWIAFDFLNKVQSSLFPLVPSWDMEEYTISINKNKSQRINEKNDKKINKYIHTHMTILLNS